MRVLFVLKDRAIAQKLKSLKAQVKKQFILKENLKKSDFKNQDLVVSVGGDGTFLSASHFTNGPILGVNSQPSLSEGALTSINLEKLDKKLEEIINKKFKIKEYSREKVCITKNSSCLVTELALNETYIGNLNPQHPSNYIIDFKNKKEQQRSSGILISTGTGSTAWYKAMHGMPFSRTKKQLRFRIREPYSRRIHKTKIKKGKIKENQNITITSLMHHGLLAIDSIRTYALAENDKIIISLGTPLKVIQ